MTREDAVLKIVTELIRTGRYNTGFQSDIAVMVRDATAIVYEMTTHAHMAWREK